jgi:hypothetical protein
MLQVGDVVKIRGSLSRTDRHICHVSSGMIQYAGQITRVKGVTVLQYDTVYQLDIDGGVWLWSESMLQVLTEVQPAPPSFVTTNPPPEALIGGQERFSVEWALRTYELSGLKPTDGMILSPDGKSADIIGAFAVSFGCSSIQTNFLEFAHAFWSRDYVSGLISGFDGRSSPRRDNEEDEGSHDGFAIRKKLIELHLMEERG